ncbi:F-box only protein 50 [Lissotriton helveticus]
MSGVGSMQHSAEEASPEPVEGQRQGVHGEKKQERGQQPACEKGEKSPCEKGEAHSVREADKAPCGNGEQSSSEKGGQQTARDEEKHNCEKGEHSVCEKGEQKPARDEEKSASEKEEQHVCEKGEQKPARDEEKSSREKGEHTACEKGEQKSVRDADKSVREKAGESVSEQKKAPGGSEQEKPSEEALIIDWRLKCDKAWKLSEDGIPTPEHLDWKDIYHKRPFGRNFLKSSNPEGLSNNHPPPPGPVDFPPPRLPLESYGDFSGWKVSTDHIPVDTSRIPPGVVVCYLPNYSWCIKEQMIDLVSEGLWEDLLDSLQPEICVLDWYEDSKLHQFVYELHVKLLGADKSTVIQEFSLTPEDSMSGDSTGWKNVSHVFKAYGPGVRHVHFLHKSKDLFVVGFHRTRLTNTAVFVKLRE